MGNHVGWQPAAVAAGDYQMARKPILGGEREVWVSPYEMWKMAEIYYAVAGSGVLTADDYNTYANVAGTGSAVGADMAVVVKDYFETSAETSLDFLGTDSVPASVSGVAVIKPPGYVANNLFSFTSGFAWDVTSSSGNTWQTLGYNGARGGTIAAKSALYIMNLPPLTTFKRVSCITSIEFASPMRPAIAIPCGMDGAGGGIKPGRTEQPTVALKAKDRGLADGLGRYGGKPCTILIKTVKEGFLTTENLFLGNCRFTVKPSSGDGNDEATVSVDGLYEYAAYFPAL